MSTKKLLTSDQNFFKITTKILWVPEKTLNRHWMKKHTKKKIIKFIKDKYFWKNIAGKLYSYFYSPPFYNPNSYFDLFKHKFFHF